LGCESNFRSRHLYERSNWLSLDVERRVKSHLARFLGVAGKIPYRTLCESKSQFDSALSRWCQKLFRSWLSAADIVAVGPRRWGWHSVSWDELRGHPATEGLCAEPQWPLARVHFPKFAKIDLKKIKKRLGKIFRLSL
jgi:hypothetical protein